MEAVMPSVDQETQQIISTYQQIYNLIFKYGSFIVLGVLSFVVILSLDTKSFTTDNDLSSLNGQSSIVPTVITSGDTYIAKGVTLNPRITSDPLSISILQGFVSISPEAQMGYGVLAQHSGIILPMSINLSSHEDNFSKAYFSTSNYKPEDLDTYIKNTILTYPVRNIQTTLFQYKQKAVEENVAAGNSFGLPKPLGADISAAALPDNSAKVIPQDTTLTVRFGLQCLGNAHLTNFFCYKNTEQFIARIPYLSFDNKLDELSLLIKDIINTPYQKSACDNLQYAFSKTPEAERQWEYIFSQCGGNYLQAYHRIVDFATVTYELQGISNSKLYADEDINIFKLLSLQQKIYHNTLQKNYDVGTIEVYLTFVQDLLTKRPNIPQLYKDMIYLYNNTYLQNALTQIAILNNNTKAMLRLTDVVKNINEGTTQLQRMVNNPELITFVDATKGSSASQQNLITFQDLFAGKFTTFDNFIVTSQKVDNDALAAQVEGYFLVEDSDGQTKRVLFVGDYLFEDENFILTQARFPQSKYLETALNKLINEHSMSIDIPFVYEFIRNNSNYASLDVSICDIIAVKVETDSCDDKGATIEDDNIIMKLVFNGYKIISVNTSNAAITSKLQSSLKSVITTQDNIATVIADLWKAAHPEDTKPSEELTGSTVDTNQFTIIGKIKQFMGVSPDSINLSSGKYIVEFTLAGIKFVAAVDISNNYKMFPIAVKKGDEVIRVNNLSLNLTNASLTEINQFKADPWLYIQRVDPSAYESAYPDN